MSKYSRFDTTVQKPEAPWEVHPIWRGIGCLMMIIIPGIAYAAAVLLVEANFKQNWLPFPREFYGPSGHPLLYAQIGVTVLLSILGYLLFVILYLIIYRFIGPPTLGPTDAPPIKRKRRNKRIKTR